jgi:hypothetical protein
MDGRMFAAMSKSELSDLQHAKSEMSAAFLKPAAKLALSARAFRAAKATAKTQNVVGVGIDEKYVDGIPTGIKAIKFLVKTKSPVAGLMKSEILPKSVAGFVTDVEEVGNIFPLAKKATVPTAATTPNPKTRLRPIQPGSSIGFEDPSNGFVMAGTFGLLVKDSANVSYILSNNHVIAFESGIEADGTKRVGIPVGSPIYQPGLLDGGKVATDKVAELVRWVDLRADQAANKVDCAIAKLTPQNIGSAEILFIGAPQGTGAAVVDMVVHKFGRTTSYRAGRVTSVAFDLTLDYEVGSVIFQDQLAVRGLNNRKFSDSGDSGSAILERSSNMVVGLLFAGSTTGNLTFGNHISDVLSQLHVKLA